MHKNGGEQLLNEPPIVLANLCVSYIMTSQNEAAEELMRKIEKEEERVILSDQQPIHHLCIVNLVIGKLYCAKGNFEFGITRIIKSLEPYDKKLSADTWYVCSHMACPQCGKECLRWGEAANDLAERIASLARLL